MTTYICPFVLSGAEWSAVYGHWYTMGDFLIASLGGHTPAVRLHTPIILHNMGLHLAIFIPPLSLLLLTAGLS